MQCPIHNTDGTPCKNPVLNNGFCAQHQSYASAEILRQITALQSELAALEKMKAKHIDLKKLASIQEEISQTKSRIRKLGRSCLESDDCRSRLRSISVDVEHLLSPDGEPNKIPNVVLPNFQQINPTDNIHDIVSNISSLAQSDQVDPVLDSWNLSKKQEAVNQEKITRLQNTIDNIGSDSEQLQYESRNEIQQLARRIDESQHEKRVAENIQSQLENQLANTESQSMTVSGHYAVYTAKLQQELEDLRVMNQTLKSREIALNASLSKFEEAESVLKSQVMDLRDSYEQKMRDLQEDYANKVKQGGQILSEREQELMGDIARLTSALQGSMQDLDRANSSNRDAMMDLQSSERPCGDLATELLSLKERMSRISREALVLQEERDNLVARKAEYEVQYQRRLADGQAANTTQIQRLNNELQSKNQDILQKQQEVTQMHNELVAVKAETENKLSQLNMQLMQTVFELKQYQNTQAQQTRMLQEKERMIADKSRAAQMDTDFKLRQAETELRRKYEESFKQLENRDRFSKNAQEQQMRELQATRIRQEAKERELGQKQGILNQSQSVYESKMAEYQRQTEQLNAALAQAQQRGDQLANLEKDYRKRVEQLRATATVDREHSQNEIKSLKSQLSDALQARSLIQANLTECAATRDSIIMQVNHLTQENSHIKNKFLSLQAQYEQAQVQHGILVEKLRTEANHLQSNVALCASQLDEIPAVHAHNKELEAKMAMYRAEVSKRDQELDGSRANLTKVIAEKEFASQKVQQLEAALMSCSTSQKMLQSNIHTSSEQIRDLQRMRHDLENAARANAAEFEHVLKDREREFKRQESRLKASQTGMSYQLKELEARNQQKTQQISSLQDQSHRIAQTLADTDMQNAQQVQVLTEATGSNYKTRPTGRSRLTTQ